VEWLDSIRTCWICEKIYPMIQETRYFAPRDRFVPERHAGTYFHRKRYGFNVQVACDVNGRFTFAGVGFLASVGDPVAYSLLLVYRDSSSVL
jgi:hypothetical protein